MFECKCYSTNFKMSDLRPKAWIVIFGTMNIPCSSRWLMKLLISFFNQKKYFWTREKSKDCLHLMRNWQKIQLMVSKLTKSVFEVFRHFSLQKTLSVPIDLKNCSCGQLNFSNRNAAFTDPYDFILSDDYFLTDYGG